MKRLAISILAVLVIIGPSRARAGLVISLGSTTLRPGGTGSIAVTISGTGSVALSSFEFAITPVGIVTSPVNFAIPQTNSEFSSSSYLFSKNSADQDGGQPGGIPSSTDPTKLFGGDNTANSSNVNLDSSSTYLLVNLDLAAGAGLPAAAGEEFLVSLVADPNYTFFVDNNFNPIGYSIDPNSSGIVTVSTATIPEPGSFFLTLAGLSALAGATAACTPGGGRVARPCGTVPSGPTIRLSDA